MSVSNRFPQWGKQGEVPDDGFEYDGGDQVNEKHLNYLWDAIQKQTDDFITKTDALQLQLDNHEAATTAHGSNGTVVGQNTLDAVQTTLEGEIATLESSFNDHSARHSAGREDEVQVEDLGTTGASGTVPVSDGDGTLTMGNAGLTAEEAFWYGSVF